MKIDLANQPLWHLDGFINDPMSTLILFPHQQSYTRLHRCEVAVDDGRAIRDNGEAVIFNRSVAAGLQRSYYAEREHIQVSCPLCAQFDLGANGQTGLCPPCHIRPLHTRFVAFPGKHTLGLVVDDDARIECIDRKSTRLNSSHLVISYAVFCLKK